MNGLSFATKAFIDRLSDGDIPWHQPWKPGYAGAVSRTTKKPYGAINQFILRHKDEYISVRQAIDEKADFKGLRTETAIFCSVCDKKTGIIDPDTGEEIKKKVFVYRTYNVLPVSLVRDKDGNPLKRKTLAIEDCADTQSVGAVDEFVRDYCARAGVSVSNGAGLTPGYDSLLGLITMPLSGQYESTEAYYAELFRWLVASTAAIFERKGDSDKARVREELTIEMGSSMLLSAFGMDTKSVFDNSVAYARKWIKHFKDDVTLALSASTRAEKAVDFILNITAP